MNKGTWRIGAKCVLARCQGNHAHAHYARTIPPFLSQRHLQLTSLGYRACKLTDVFGIQRSAVSSRPAYSALMNSSVLPIVIGLDSGLASMDFCLAKHRLLSWNINRNFCWRWRLILICLCSGTSDTQSLNTQDLEMYLDLFTLTDTRDFMWLVTFRKMNACLYPTFM